MQYLYIRLRIYDCNKLWGFVFYNETLNTTVLISKKDIFTYLNSPNYKLDVYFQRNGFHRYCGKRMCDVDKMSLRQYNNMFNIPLKKSVEQESGNKVRKAEEKRVQLLSFNERMRIVNEEKFKDDLLIKCFRRLGEKPFVIREIIKCIKCIIEHRTGTPYEDLAFVNSVYENDKCMKRSLINKNYDYYNEEDGISMCKPSEAMLDMIDALPEHTVIGIHNHPYSNIVTIDDINVCFLRKYKYGLVVCHDGRIYKYCVGDKYNKELMSYGVYIDLKKLSIALSKNDIKEEKLVINNLLKKHIEMEVLQ